MDEISSAHGAPPRDCHTMGPSVSSTRTARVSIDVAGSPEIVDLTVREPATWFDVHTALAPWGVTSGTLIDGRRLDGSCRIDAATLPDGARLSTTVAAAEPASLRIVVERGPEQGRVLALPSTVLLGRGHTLLGDDPFVSRTHARVDHTHGTVTVVDCASTCGTRLDGRPLVPHRSTPWSVGQHLEVGDTLLLLDAAPDPAEAKTAPVPLHRPGEPLTVEWPQPVQRPTSASQLHWVAALVPLPVAAGLAWWLHSPVLLAFMLLGPLVLGVTTVIEHRRGRHAGRVGRRRLAAERADAQRQLCAAVDAERSERRALHPGPAHLLDLVRGRSTVPLAPATQVPHLRIGHGRSPSRHRVVIGNRPRHVPLDDAPVTLELTPGVVQLRTPVGQADTTLEWLTAQLVALGPPAGRRAAVVTPLADTRRWCWLDHPSIPVSSDLVRITSDRTPTPPRAVDVEEVVVVDGRTPGATFPGRDLAAPGRCVIWVGPDAPAGVTREIVLTPGRDGGRLDTGEAFTPDAPVEDWFPTLTQDARREPRLTHPGCTTRGFLPVVTPDVLFDADPSPWDREPIMAVPIGLDARGDVVALDLARHGPHALVAGTTGSGKSEFLLAYLYGLFRLNSPSTVTALLIDYKGGSTFRALERMPHVVGVVTDLDDELGARALTALSAEIDRRERLLAEQGHRSFAEACELPRLIVVVDEFRVLADELPDFVDGLVHLAAVGRSLGIHLVLATQRPGGVVTADMRTNLDARIALRVRERSDSLDILDSPVAADIPHEAPGRAYLSLGGEAPLEVQTALVTGPVRSTGAPRVEVCPLDEDPAGRPGGSTDTTTTWLTELTDQARDAASGHPEPHRPLLPPLPDLLTLRDTSPLRVTVTWEDLSRSRPSPSPGQAPNPVAVADLPHAQAWAALDLPIAGHLGIAGAGRSGRTTAARSLARSFRAQGRRIWWCGPAAPPGADRIIAADSQRHVAELLSHLDDGTRGVLLVIDTWEAIAPTLAALDHGLGEQHLVHLLREARDDDVRCVVTGARAVLSSRLTPVLDTRVVLRQGDPAEYALAGLRPTQVPGHLPPGRGVVAPHGHVVQFLTDDGQASESRPSSSSS